MKVEQDVGDWKVTVEVSLEEADINRAISTCKDPISKMHWLKLLLRSITPQEIHDIREFIENQGPGVPYLDWVEKAIAEVKPIIETMDVDVKQTPPGILRDEDIIR